MLFGVDGSVIVFKTDESYKLESCELLASSLEFEPTLVAHFSQNNSSDCRMVASSAGYTSILDFSCDPPKIETTKRKNKNFHLDA